MANLLRLRNFERAGAQHSTIISDGSGKANWEDFDTYLESRTATLYTLTDDGGTYNFNIGDDRTLALAGETSEISVTSNKVAGVITETITLEPRYFIAEQLIDAATSTTATDWIIPIPPEWNGKKIISFTANNSIGAGEDVTWRVETIQGAGQTLVTTLVLNESTTCNTSSGLNTTLATCEGIQVSITSVTGTPQGGSFVLTIQ